MHYPVFRFGSVLLVAGLFGCAPPPPPAVAVSGTAHGKLEPAPTPSVNPMRVSNWGAYSLALPPRAPPNTGAVYGNGGPVNGSITTGLRQGF